MFVVAEELLLLALAEAPNSAVAMNARVGGRGGARKSSNFSEVARAAPNREKTSIFPRLVNWRGCV